MTTILHSAGFAAWLPVKADAPVLSYDGGDASEAGLVCKASSQQCARCRLAVDVHVCFSMPGEPYLIPHFLSVVQAVPVAQASGLSPAQQAVFALKESAGCLYAAGGGTPATVQTWDMSQERCTHQVRCLQPSTHACASFACSDDVGRENVQWPSMLRTLVALHTVRAAVPDHA